MPDHFRESRRDKPRRDAELAPIGPSLPNWLAQLILDPGESVQMVRGPRTSPSLEPWLTHPALFLAAVPPAVLCLAFGRIVAGSWEKLSPAAALLSIGLLVGTIMVLGASAGYFTRLVATDRRLLIIQGRSLLSSRNLEDLPPAFLTRVRGADGTDRGPAIDVTAVNRMLGGGEGGFVDADAILKLGKTLGQMRSRREEDR